jgi:hypothetical protein
MLAHAAESPSVSSTCSGRAAIRSSTEMSHGSPEWGRWRLHGQGHERAAGNSVARKLARGRLACVRRGTQPAGDVIPSALRNANWS